MAAPDNHENQPEDAPVWPVQKQCRWPLACDRPSAPECIGCGYCAGCCACPRDTA